jgi:hypothetical protein
VYLLAIKVVCSVNQSMLSISLKFNMYNGIVPIKVVCSVNQSMFSISLKFNNMYNGIVPKKVKSNKQQTINEYQSPSQWWKKKHYAD